MEKIVSNFTHGEFIKYGKQIYQYQDSMISLDIDNNPTTVALIRNPSTGELLNVSVDSISKLTDSTVTPGTICRLNIYDILKEHPDFKKVFSSKFGKYLDIVKLENNNIICSIQLDKECIDEPTTVYYNKHGYRIDNDTQEVIESIAELFPDDMMNRWIGYDFDKNVHVGEIEPLKKYIINRTGNWVFTNVSGYGIIKTTGDNMFTVGGHIDRFHFDYNGRYYGSDRSGVGKSPISQMVMVHTSPDDSITWEKWFEESRWRGAEDSEYYYINDVLEIVRGIERFDDKCNKHFERGNYFKTYSDAEKMLSKVSVLFKPE